VAKKVVKDPAEQPVIDSWVIGTAILVYVLALLYVSLHLGDAISMVHQSVPVNPLGALALLVRGKLQWPRAATVIAALILAGTFVLYLLYRRWRGRGSEGRLPIDAKADVMGTGGQLDSLTEASVRAKAADLGLRLAQGDEPGVCIGVSVSDGFKVYGSYEDLHLDIWGPRQGKSTSRVIPAILEAPGAVISTSNKRDVVDATRDVRAAHGHPVYVFDPQGVAGERPTWHWDPLAWVRGQGRDFAGAEVRAAKLAGHFADSDDGQDAKSDAFFDPEGEDLLAGLFLTAALTGKTVLDVWEWVSDSQNNEPVLLLNELAQNELAHTNFYRDKVGSVLYPPATGLAAQYNAEGRTKAGVFGTAKKMARCLKLTSIHAWVSQGKGSNSPALDELDLVSRHGTLYCLSLEGRGSAGALVSALTEAVIDVATRKASESPGGRLPVPLLAVLDEAANVVRWKDLPKQYSHFGSRGIVVMTVLQSWAQGARCWGVDGMNAMWAAANIRVLGSGVDDTNFLRERSEAIGDNDAISKSISKSGGGTSISQSLSSGRTFSVADLIALPRGRVIVFPSGGKAALVRTIPWWEGPYAEEVRGSIARHDPGSSVRQRTEVVDLVRERQDAVDAAYIGQEAPPL
jgi:type IV secretory pathway TraG/TraD family ATPase VirD4